VVDWTNLLDVHAYLKQYKHFHPLWGEEMSINLIIIRADRWNYVESEQDTPLSGLLRSVFGERYTPSSAVN
jgi:hypothetical protein